MLLVLVANSRPEILDHELTNHLFLIIYLYLGDDDFQNLNAENAIQWNY